MSEKNETSIATRTVRFGRTPTLARTAVARSCLGKLRPDYGDVFVAEEIITGFDRDRRLGKVRRALFGARMRCPVLSQLRLNGDGFVADDIITIFDLSGRPKNLCDAFRRLNVLSASRPFSRKSNVMRGDG